MKDIFGLVFVTLGMFIVEFGFKMLSPALQDKFDKEMRKKMSAFLKKRKGISGNRTLLNTHPDYPPRE